MSLFHKEENSQSQTDFPLSLLEHTWRLIYCICPHRAARAASLWVNTDLCASGVQSCSKLSWDFRHNHPRWIQSSSSAGFHNRVYICCRRTAYHACILTAVKYAPAHSLWVGAPTKGNTVDALHVSRRPFRIGEAQWRFAQYPLSSSSSSSPLTGEKERKGGIQSKKEKNILLSIQCGIWLSPVFRMWILYFFLPKNETFLLKTLFYRGCWTKDERTYFNLGIAKLLLLASMARGIDSLVSLNPFFSMDLTGEHSDNCKFWLLDLGMCPNPDK